MIGLALLIWLAPAAASDPVKEEVSSVAKELERGLSGLRLPGAPQPYFAEVRLVRADLLALDGSYGGIVTDLAENQTSATVRVKVGTPKSDDSGYIAEHGGQVRFEIARLPSASFAGKSLWLAMDEAFRGSTRAYSSKQATLDRLALREKNPDFAPGPKPLQKYRLDALPAVEWDREGLSRMVVGLSDRFASAPKIDNGDVYLQVLRTHELVVTSEGIALDWIKHRAVLAVVADTQASDGMHLDHGRAIHLQKIPSTDGEIQAAGEKLVDKVLSELTELAAAPMLEEDYDGPILFSQEAAPQLLASMIATQAAGDPPPYSDLGRMVELEPLWQSRLGKTVMPPYIDVEDDPDASGFGDFHHDAEGFTGEKLVLVRSGRLENLLMTRTPNEFAAQSNGRARMTPALEVGPAISNLSLISRKGGMSRTKLRRELLRLAREDGYDFAYEIELLRDGAILGPPPRDTAVAFGGSRKVNLPLAARVFRVEPNGKRTLVRGAILAPASMRVLRRIRAVGNEPRPTPMRIRVGSSGGFGRDLGSDGVLGQTVDVQVTSADLLVEGMELLVERGEQEKQPSLQHPLRRPAKAEPKAIKAHPKRTSPR